MVAACLFWRVKKYALARERFQLGKRRVSRVLTKFPHLFRHVEEAVELVRHINRDAFLRTGILSAALARVDGKYAGFKDGAAIYVSGKLDRFLDGPKDVHDLCKDAVYAPFPELETLAR